MIRSLLEYCDSDAVIPAVRMCMPTAVHGSRHLVLCATVASRRAAQQLSWKLRDATSVPPTVRFLKHIDSPVGLLRLDGVITTLAGPASSL